MTTCSCDLPLPMSEPLCGAAAQPEKLVSDLPRRLPPPPIEQIADVRLTHVGRSPDFVLGEATPDQVFDELFPVHTGNSIAFALNSKRHCDRGMYHNSDMKTLAERLKEARSDKGLSQTALAKLVGIGQATVASIENGRNRGSTYITKIARVLNVSPEWLADGIGDKSASRLDNNVRPITTPGRQVPIIDYVQAGMWHEIADPFPPGAAFEYIISFSELSDSAFALRIRGDSMSPEFVEGDVIVVDPAVAPRPGSFVVAKNGGEEATFKKYRSRGIDQHGDDIFELVPLNDDYPTLRSDETHCFVIGTAVEVRKQLR